MSERVDFLKLVVLRLLEFVDYFLENVGFHLALAHLVVWVELHQLVVEPLVNLLSVWQVLAVNVLEYLKEPEVDNFKELAVFLGGEDLDLNQTENGQEVLNVLIELRIGLS